MYHEATSSTSGDPGALVRACIESGADQLLLDSETLSPDFYDLSTRCAGTLLHHASLYHIPVALVVPDPTLYSQPFQDFVREANRGSQIRFFTSREGALAWLKSLES